MPLQDIQKFWDLENIGVLQPSEELNQEERDNDKTLRTQKKEKKMAVML